jgi:hypothetical protein
VLAKPADRVNRVKARNPNLFVGMRGMVILLDYLKKPEVQCKSISVSPNQVSRRFYSGRTLGLGLQ